MELGRIPGDPYAGYIVDDSDLEYSDCSGGEESSEEDECSVVHTQQQVSNQDSDDEFEKEMNSEVLKTLEIMASPACLQATRTRVMNAGSSLPKSAATGGVQSTQASIMPPSSKSVRFQTQRPEQNEAEGSGSKQTDFYDEIYFDSSGSSGEDDVSDPVGQEQEDGGRPVGQKGNASHIGKRKLSNVGKKVQKMTDDELFYDPKMDEADEQWVRRQRMAYYNVKVSHQLEQEKKLRLAHSSGEDSDTNMEQRRSSEKSTENGSGDPERPGTSSAEANDESETTEEPILPKSDATLNCPACMTALCLDCQRHDIYVNQYRAMFVINCRVFRDEVLKYIPKPGKKFRKRRKRKNCNEEKGGEDCDPLPEAYNPVRCSECDTEVAVLDKDDVFHFFNVLASAPT